MEKARRMVADTVPGATGVPQDFGPLAYAAILGAVVFFWAVFGIFTRPVGHLAAFWPVNAILLGLLVRFPRLASWQGWCGALLGYVAADLITGGRLLPVLMLTGANLAGVAVGHALMRRLPAADRRLKRPLSVLYLALIVVAASSAAGLVGAMVGPILFGDGPFTGWAFWFVAELVNYIAILPLILTLPEARAPRWPWRAAERRGGRFAAIDLLPLLPAVAVPVSALLSVLIGGPGAFAFPVPALLWCAVSYSLFVNALLALLFSAWTLLAMSLGYLVVSFDINSRPVLMSVRVGVTLIALAPLVVASVMAARNELLARLQYVATHDSLTGLLNRGAFRERAATLLAKLAAGARPTAVLMLDIDRFKAINDTYGHAAGDRVLVAFSRILSDNLRTGDVVGRMGGEEFAIVLADCGRDTARDIARRIGAAFGAASVDLEDGRQVQATVSIGVAAMAAAGPDVEPLLAAADGALYQAKDAGRNRVEMAEAGVPAPAMKS